MPSAERLTHWSIPVKDVDESEAFYRDFLGLEYRGRLGNTRASVFRVAGADFICWETGEMTDPHVRAAGLHYAFTFSPADWDAAVQEISNRGFELNGPIVYRERGVFLGREIYILDPSGNVVELTDPTWQPGMPTPTFEEITASSAIPG